MEKIYGMHKLVGLQLFLSGTPTFSSGTPTFCQMGVLNSCFQNPSESSDLYDYLYCHISRDQARGRLGRNSRPRGRNFALNGTLGEVGVSLKKKKNFFFFFFFFLRETHFHSVITQMQAVVTLSAI